MFKVIDDAVSILSGEWILKLWPNGGTVVALRTLLTGGLISGVSMSILKFICNSDLCSLECFKIYGAIFAGVYTVFYSRYAAQWTFIANLYNKIKETEVRMDFNNKESVRHLKQWKASFIQDANELHLATKPKFASIIQSWIRDGSIVELLNGNPVFGEQKFHAMMAKVSEVVNNNARAAR